MKEPKIDWSKIPDGYQIGYSSVDGPMWLRLIAKTPILSNYSYVLAYKFGHTKITKSPELGLDSDPINFEDPHWRDPISGKSVQDMVNEGSLAFMGYREKGEKRKA